MRHELEVNTFLGLEHGVSTQKAAVWFGVWNVTYWRFLRIEIMDAPIHAGLFFLFKENKGSS